MDQADYFKLTPEQRAKYLARESQHNNVYAGSGLAQQHPEKCWRCEASLAQENFYGGLHRCEPLTAAQIRRIVREEIVATLTQLKGP